MPIATQALLFDAAPELYVAPPRGQLLKWVGNKQRMAAYIATHFPPRFNVYHEPFLGSGAILAAVAPEKGYASDSFKPLMEIWLALRHKPEKLKKWYSDRWRQMEECEKVEVYENVKASFNRSPNGADLLFLCRSCYGGIVRFRKADGYMSTPCGVHDPISPESFARRVDEWHRRVRNTSFEYLEYEEAMRRAQRSDLVYCDPPYSHSQAILYGAQDFSLAQLLEEIGDCKKRGVFVALSIDGMKKSGDRTCDLPIPRGLFEREVFIDCGRSMLRRFQMAGESLEGEHVSDRLLLTY
ncbi:MAG: Dam family site-specific DNA-(adenine-N6)-methyltransferase [Thermoanaerobaculia bacterium]